MSERIATSPRARLSIEPLEDRAVPATFAAATAAELIAALDAANQTPEADQVTLAPGTTFTLTAVNNTTDGRNGLPLIAGNVTILGNNDVIERSSAAGIPAFRIAAVAAGASLTLTNLTLRGGLARGDFFQSPLSDSGGAVLNQGTAALGNVTLQNNTAQGLAAGWTMGFGFNPWSATDGLGGAVYSSGVLTMTDCTTRGNAAVGGQGIRGIYLTPSIPGNGGGPTPGKPGANGLGGGVYVAGGTAAITNSAFTGNTAQGGNGGGGYPDGSTRGGDGGDGLGGGLYADGGRADLRGVSVSENAALGGAGGIGTGSKPDGAKGQGVGGGLYLFVDASAGLDGFTADHVKQNSASKHKNIHGDYDRLS